MTVSMAQFRSKWGLGVVSIVLELLKMGYLLPWFREEHDST